MCLQAPRCFLSWWRCCTSCWSCLCSRPWDCSMHFNRWSWQVQNSLAASHMYADPVACSAADNAYCSLLLVRHLRFSSVVYHVHKPVCHKPACSLWANACSSHAPARMLVCLRLSAAQWRSANIPHVKPRHCGALEYVDYGV